MRLIFIILFLAFVSFHSTCQAQEFGKPIKLSEAVNSSYAERMPLISLDGKALYFARKAHPQNMGAENKDDIWVSYLNPKTKKWGKAINVGAPLNNDGHNFVVSINTSADAMYLANDYQQNLRDAISYTTKKGRRWSTPYTIDIPDYKNTSPYVSYHVSKDEKFLLIAAEQKDTEGARDFYVCFATRTGWSSPLNLGSDINSKGEENSIFLAADNKTVYFSSDGHGGLGGYDLFVSKRLDDTWTRWSTPKNLGPVINTPSNDLSISIPASGEFAYMARGPIDNTDIYKIKIPKAFRPAPVTFIQAQLVDAETKQPIDGQIYFESLDRGRDPEKDMHRGESAYYIADADMATGIYAQAKGYFPISTYYAEVLDELEQVDSDTDAYYSNSELQSLQNKLDDIQRELKKLQAKKDQSEDRKEKTSKKKVNTSQSKSRKISSSFKDVGEDTELDELKSKYQNHFEGSDAPAEKRVAKAKESDSDALKKAREKYQQFYNDELSNENDQEVEVKTRNTSSLEEIYEHAEKVVSDMFDEYYPTVVRSVKKTESINLSTKDVDRIRLAIEEEVSDMWIPKVIKRTEKNYNNELGKETKLRLRQDLKDEFAESVETEVTLLIKKQKEKNIESSIQRQLESQESKAAPKKEIVQKKTNQPKYKEVEKKLPLIPLKEGATMSLNNIFFDVNKSELKDQSTLELQRVFEFLDENPQLRIEIGGHTNGWCSPEFAKDLSEDRSKAVYDYLIGNGIKKSRLTYKGYGKSDPIATNETKAGRRKNQRVELKILEIIE